MVADLNPDEPASGNDAGWPLRSWGLALLGALVGLAIYHIVNEGSRYHWTEDATRLALASFLSTAGIAFAFVVWVVFSQLLMLHLPAGPIEHLIFPGA